MALVSLTFAVVLSFLVHSRLAQLSVQVVDVVVLLQVWSIVLVLDGRAWSVRVGAVSGVSPSLSLLLLGFYEVSGQLFESFCHIGVFFGAAFVKQRRRGADLYTGCHLRINDLFISEVTLVS